MKKQKKKVDKEGEGKFGKRGKMSCKGREERGGGPRVRRGDGGGLISAFTTTLT